MATLLLWYKADHTLKANGKQALNALQMAEKMSLDPKCKLSAQAAEIVTLIQDPEALKVRWDKVADKINKENERHDAQAKLCIKIIYTATAAVLLIWYLGWGRSAGNKDAKEL